MCNNENVQIISFRFKLQVPFCLTINQAQNGNFLSQPVSKVKPKCRQAKAVLSKGKSDSFFGSAWTSGVNSAFGFLSTLSTLDPGPGASTEKCNSANQTILLNTPISSLPPPHLQNVWFTDQPCPSDEQMYNSVTGQL